MKSALDEDVAKAITTLRAVVAIAGANFPGKTEVRISVAGAGNGMTGSVIMPSYVLARLLDKAEGKAP